MGLALFLLAVAAAEDKTQRKQAKDKRVFLRFEDDLAVDDELYGDSSAHVLRKIGKDLCSRSLRF